MADMSKASINARYDKIRQMIKDGKISAKEAAKLGRGMHKDYFSKSNAAQRKKDATPKAQVAKKPPVKPPVKGSTNKPPAKGSANKPPSSRRSDGTSGAPMPPNPPGQRQTRASLTKTVPAKNRRGRTTGSKQVPVKPSSTRKKYNRRGRRI